MASPFTPPTIPGAQGYPLGLTGATAATRYVGGTTSGSPATGTFAVGDFIIDETGAVYVCTVAGSPGTWTQAGGGGSGAVAYAEVTSDVTVTSTTEATPDSIVSLGAVTYTAVRHRFVFQSAMMTVVGAAIPILQFWDDTTLLFRTYQFNNCVAGTWPGPCFTFFYTPTAASHTFKVMGFRSGGTSFTLEADSTTGAGKFSPIQFSAAIA